MVNFVTFFAPKTGTKIPCTIVQQLSMLSESIVQTMPDASIHLILPGRIKAPKVPGLKAHPLGDSPPGLMNMKIQSWIDACTFFPNCDLVLLDPDTLVVGKIDRPFVFPNYHVGLSWHPDISLPHQINAGVLFVPRTAHELARVFFGKCHEQIALMDHQYADWYGDQQALVNLVGHKYISGPTLPSDVSVDNTKVHFFDWAIWNRWPTDENDLSALRDEKARILHFKGARKAIMPKYYTMRFSDR